MSDRGSNDACRPEHGACQDSLSINDNSVWVYISNTSIGMDLHTQCLEVSLSFR